MKLILRTLLAGAAVAAVLALPVVVGAAPQQTKPIPYNPLKMPPPPDWSPETHRPGQLDHFCGTGVWKPRIRISDDFDVVSRGSTSISETESNENPGTAQAIPLGFDGGEFDTINLSGSLAGLLATPTSFSDSEDNDTITTADVSGITAGTSDAATVDAFIGDSSFHAGNRDVDFYSIPANSGQTISVEIFVDSFGTTLGDSYIGLYDSAGTLLVSDDDSGSDFLGSALTYTTSSADTYYLCVSGWNGFGDANNLPADPFTGGSVANGSTATGTYQADIYVDGFDADWFSFELEAGDIFGASLTGSAATSGLYDSSSLQLMGSESDSTFLYPTSSPLPGSGSTANFGVVAPSTGTYYFQPRNGTGAWAAELSVFRPSLESQPELNHQILFLDFDGVTGLDCNALFGTGSSSANLSPLSLFLFNWGLSSSDEAAVIDAITARVQAIMDDIAANANNGSLAVSGTPGDFKVTVLNSKDHPDVFGQPNVSRLIIGGTIAQSGISTIGIAETIDVGNFATEETAIILLDLLSASAGDPNSLNQYSIDASSSKIDLIGVGVGNIAAHEAAHFFGNWHTDQFNTVNCIIDQGGNLNNTVGVGPDSIFGNANDIDVLNVVDEFNPNEGFVGFQDSKNAIAFGLATGTQPGLYRDILTDDVTYSGERAGDDVIAISSGGANAINLTAAHARGGTVISSVNSFTALLHGGDDTVTAVASATVPITVDGGGETSGDTLTFDDQGITTTPPTPSGPSGTISSGSRQDFTYSSFENFNLLPVELSGFTLD